MDENRRHQYGGGFHDQLSWRPGDFGSLLRVFGLSAAAFAIQAPVSAWLILCTSLGALFLALAKRRQELVLLENGAGGHRKSLDDYSIQFVDQLIGIVTASTIIAYSLYTFTAENLPKNQTVRVRSVNVSNRPAIPHPLLCTGSTQILYLFHTGLCGSLTVSPVR